MTKFLGKKKVLRCEFLPPSQVSWLMRARASRRSRPSPKSTWPQCREARLPMPSLQLRLCDCLCLCLSHAPSPAQSSSTNPARVLCYLMSSRFPLPLSFSNPVSKPTPKRTSTLRKDQIFVEFYVENTSTPRPKTFHPNFSPYHFFTLVEAMQERRTSAAQNSFPQNLDTCEGLLPEQSKHPKPSEQ